ncbi:MAG: twin-arginine translocase TatA/TatE family subunit [Candidatus Paceibacterota bacterium]|jgi:sec-independent protein translocase protein TatA
MFGLGTREIIILAGLIVLLFGSKKIPELARGIGEAIGYIRGGFSDESEEEDSKGKTSKNR